MRKTGNPTNIVNLTGHTLIFTENNESHIIAPSDLLIPTITKNVHPNQLLQIGNILKYTDKIVREFHNLPPVQKNTIYLCMPEKAEHFQRPDIYGVMIEEASLQQLEAFGIKLNFNEEGFLKSLTNKNNNQKIKVGKGIAIASTLYHYPTPHLHHTKPIPKLRTVPATNV